MLTDEILRRLWPRAPQSKIEAIVAIAPQVLAEYGITSALRLAHLMAQISHECGGGTIARENMNYSAARLMQIFGVGHHSAAVTAAEAQRLAHHPEQIAERVYGLGNPKKARELGNLRAGDGYRFRGGGDLQLTGGGSYRRMGEAAGVDLYGNPDQIGDPTISFRVACAEFQALGCLPFADKDNVGMVTRKVNGGTNGLAERTAWLRKWKIALPELPDVEPAADEPQLAPRGAETPPPKALTDSKIFKAAAAAATATAAPLTGEVIKTANAPAIDPAPSADLLDKITDGIAKVQPTIEAAPDGFWPAIGHLLTDPLIASVCLAAALGAIGFVIWERRRKLREEGV